MEKKMSVMGVGAKIAVPVLIYVAAAEVVSLLLEPAFSITANYNVLLITGIALIVIGFSLCLAAAFSMLKAHKEARLATGGLYAVFRDPMYVMQIFLTLPGLFLLLNSWLVMLGVVPAYAAYRVFVKQEHRYLEKLFKEQYREYVDKVPVKL